ncbi:MAG: metallophosphoesterase [Methanocellales archaeon]|nr:metallophosphoesterase [Methanocellales archaeon]MDD5446515.1 metallophosphoesterase [Methanocellales archaeon]
MNDIVAVGDVHEGINFGFRINPDTGLSERVLDIHNNFARTAQFAIDNKSKLFVVLGDLFDRTHVSPIFREMIRRDVMEPLKDAGIPVWILAGNHDQPRGKKGTSTDDFRGYPHVNVYRKPAVETLEINGKGVGCLIVPYMHPTHISELVLEKFGKETPVDQTFILGQELLKQWLQKRVEELDVDFKLLFAHYHVEGAKLRDTSYPEVLPGEFSFRKDMIPDVDLAVFGHVHLHQTMHIRGTEVLYCGAVERIDWGEMEDEKGFIVISPFDEIEWRFEKLPTRDMLKIKVEANRENPMQKILDAIPDVTGKLVRLEIKIDEGLRSKVVDAEIADKLKDAFHYEVRWNEREEEKLGFVSFTMDPFKLLKDFIDLNYGGHPKHDELQRRGESILKTVL